MVGAALIALGLVGVGFAIATIVSVVGQAPDSERTFATGEMVTERFEAGETKVVFVDTGGAGGHDVNCDVAARDGNSARLQRFDGDLTLNRWEAVFTVTAQDAGEYRISCGGQPSDTFGVGGFIGGFIGAMFGAFVGAGVAFMGLVVVIATAIVRHVRRPTTAG